MVLNYILASIQDFCTSRIGELLLAVQSMELKAQNKDLTSSPSGYVNIGT